MVAKCCVLGWSLHHISVLVVYCLLSAILLLYQSLTGLSAALNVLLLHWTFVFIFAVLHL